MSFGPTVDALRQRLHQPFAVFDAGIGSYAAVRAIQDRFPQQDILYLADRASFPYGDKTRDELLAVMRRTLRFLDAFGPAAVLIASNAPSVMLLDDLQNEIAAPVLGVRPPIRDALHRAGNGDVAVAVLGVRSLVESPEFTAYVTRQAANRASHVHAMDASPLVERVESGAFLFAEEETQIVVDAFVAAMMARHPRIGAVTLSSTHLPWLRPFFQRSCRETPLLDPLDSCVSALADHAQAGAGAVVGLVTEDGRYGAGEFGAMLDRLAIRLEMHVVAL